MGTREGAKLSPVVSAGEIPRGMRNEMKERVGDVGASNGRRNRALRKAGPSLLTQIGSSTSSFSPSHAHSQKISNTTDTSSTSELVDPSALSASASASGVEDVEENGVRTKRGKGEERERVDSDEGRVVGAKGKKWIAERVGMRGSG